MSKQVRLRRGTTADHATFTGAEGELTYDTTRHCLILHDGITPGGKALSWAFVLDTGNSADVQVIKSSLQIDGESNDGYGLTITNVLKCLEQIQADNGLLASSSIQILVGNLQLTAGITIRTPNALAYAANVSIPFNRDIYTLTLAGDVTFSTAGRFSGAMQRVIITADNAQRTLTFPGTWKWVGGAAPANIAANKVGVLELLSYGNTDATIIARWSVQP